MIFEELHYIIGRPGELITAAGNYITSAALSGIFMPCVCVMHCRRRFFFGKNDVPGICMPCVCVMHCRRRFFFGKNGPPGFGGPRTAAYCGPVDRGPRPRGPWTAQLLVEPSRTR